uniref:autotransporter outer membrane beta-barrel domain-containing protein n=1 Tax=Dialister sp. TaxID=1955814 RepID=UPI0040256590
MKLSKKMAAMMAAAALLSGVQMAAAEYTEVTSTPSEEYTTDVVNNKNSGIGAVGRYYLYTYGKYAATEADKPKTKVTFSNMKFTDNTVKNTGTSAKTSDTSGGAAVFIKGSDVTFNDVGFTGNTVTSESGALSNGGAVFVDSTRSNHNYDASVTFNVTKDMAYTGNKVTGASKYSDTYGNIATTSGGFLYMDRGTTANFNIDEGATLTIGKKNEIDDNTDSIASSIKTKDQTYKENAINKKGKGTLTVNGSMSGYHGDLYVTEGTMNINHSLAGDANITVSDGATLNLNEVELSSQPDTTILAANDKNVITAYSLPKRDGSLVAQTGSKVTAKTITLKDKSSMKVNTGATVTADSVAVNGTLSNAGTVEAKNSITVDGGFFVNTGTLTTDKLTISGNVSDQSKIAGEIYANKEFLYKGIAGNLAQREVTASIHTPVLHIQGNTNQTGFKITSDNVLKDVDKIIIEAKNNTRTGLVFDGDVHVTSNIELTGTSDARIEINDGKSVQIDQITSTAAKGLVQVNDSGSVKLGNIDAQQGRMVLQTNGRETQKGSYELQNIHVGENASFEMCVYDDNSHVNPPAEITGQIQAYLDKDAKIDFGGMHANNWKPDKINVAADSLTVHIADASSDNKVYISGKSRILQQPSHVAVVADGNNNTGNAAKDLQAISKVVEVTTQTESSTANTSKPASGVKVTQEASRIFDEASGVVETKENGTVAVGQLTVKKNPFSYGVSDTNALSLMTWRAEMNDMNKRMGELRDSKGEHGIWARMVRGRTEYGSVSNQYNQYQLGYDRTLGTENTWTLGGAVTYTEGDSAYGAGSAENKHTGFALYGSKLNGDGSFLDLIAKYARLDDDYKTIWGNGSGDANGFSVSAEYGKRFTQDTGFWVEPQAELTYGHVSSMSYHLGDISVDQDGINSLVGRLGFSLGKNIKKGNVYARASYLYDFDGDTSVHFTDGGSLRTLKQDLGGGWWEVGIGTNLNLSDIAHFYFDIEKTFGGDIAIPWQWNAGIRWSF